MELSNYISAIKDISYKYYRSESNIALSKALSFSFLYSYLEVIGNSVNDVDVLNSNVDSSTDRGIDFVYIDDNDDECIRVLIGQSKYTESGRLINEDDVSKYILNFKAFPFLQGNVNKKLENAISQYKLIDKNSDVKIKKIGMFVGLGEFTDSALNQLESSGIEVYNFDRINNELFLSKFLPDFKVTFKNAPIKYNKEAYLTILHLNSFLDNSYTQKIIKDGSIFHYNVRGVMNNSSNSISEDIKKTIIENPESLFSRNNGLTVICEKFIKLSKKEYSLVRASIVNGQQSIRTTLGIWHEINDSKKKRLDVPIKILIYNPDSINSQNEVLAIAKATNRQNSYKESDAYSIDKIQEDIARYSENLAGTLSFKYVTKRTIEKNEGVREITKNQAIVVLNTFFNLNPSDKIEALFKNSYDKIFNQIRPEYISILLQLQEKITSMQEQQDKNGDTKVWGSQIYKKFKKARTANYSMYILSLILGKKFNFSDIEKKKCFLDDIYKKMKESDNFDISSYFNNEFWVVFLLSSLKFMSSLYNDNEIIPDFMRKPLSESIDNMKYSIDTFFKAYNDIINSQTAILEFKPKILLY